MFQNLIVIHVSEIKHILRLLFYRIEMISKNEFRLETFQRMHRTENFTLTILLLSVYTRDQLSRSATIHNQRSSIFIKSFISMTRRIFYSYKSNERKSKFFVVVGSLNFIKSYKASQIENYCQRVYVFLSAKV